MQCYEFFTFLGYVVEYWLFDSSALALVLEHSILQFIHFAYPINLGSEVFG